MQKDTLKLSSISRNALTKSTKGKTQRPSIILNIYEFPATRKYQSY